MLFVACILNCRIQIFSIERIVWENKWQHRKMDTIDIHWFGKNRHKFYYGHVYCQFCWLFFWKNCLWIAASGLVSLDSLVYFIGVLNTNWWNWRFPWDTNRPFGYIIAFSVQYVMNWATVISAMCNTSFYTGTFLMLNAITKDIKEDLNAINECATLNANRLKCLKLLSKFIKLHSSAKQLSIYKQWIE